MKTVNHWNRFDRGDHGEEKLPMYIAQVRLDLTLAYENGPDGAFRFFF